MNGSAHAYLLDRQRLADRVRMAPDRYSFEALLSRQEAE